MNKGVKQGYIYVFLSAILWGMLPVFTRLLYAAGSTPLEVSSVRAYLGAGMALLAMLFSGDIRKCRLKDVPFYMLYGTFAIAGAFRSMLYQCGCFQRQWRQSCCIPVRHL